MTHDYITKLDACQADGTPINASHRVVTKDVQLLSPTDPQGQRTTVTTTSGAQFLVPHPPHEVAKTIGWE